VQLLTDQQCGAQTPEYVRPWVMTESLLGRRFARGLQASFKSW